MTKQRLRIVFVKGPELKYISHLDLALAWERALRRAGVPLAYSQGHTPHARMQIASGLPLGYFGSAEMMDVFLAEPMAPTEFGDRVGPALPRGLRLKSVEEVPLKSPSLQSALRQAEYRVTIQTSVPAAELAERVASLLAADHFAQQRTRKGRQESFDLRPLVKEVGLATADQGDGQAVLTMRLSAGQRGNVRPDAVLAALGLVDAYAVVERTQLAFEFDKD
jgi:radical SAM-linked protein